MVTNKQYTAARQCHGMNTAPFLVEWLNICV